jgi:tRNA nucleotidyltransferase (CCA-adding enzyme)
LTQIVLTHEQADFDALASLLGAYLLDETAIPVLPRRMNRNVQAFLTLYGVDLPFVDPRDLPSEPVDLVTLVDTQAMVSIKGVGPATRVAVVDHHPRRENLPAQWSILRDETGATTTLLVEILRERDGALSTAEATLLLLGIYEDTGSLTYTRTTARDLRAAAYLLDQGANLQIASNFLNHPLSQSQQAIYDRLRAHTEYHTIYGHSVVITTGDAQDMDEELSTIAHKLRDLLDPDGLFVLVTTRGGVQMIARSTSDQIDVAEILSAFGGGGHERAAAGLIRERSMPDVHAELLELLPRLVRPAITVAQIMSREPQVLTPATPVQEAAQKMRRFGYEGYPVVEGDQVIGLLTRRAVDRAISHNLHKTASSLMDAGSYTVHPDDSIEHLQRLMTESGWGQVPVVHPETGKIIAIVTRTDLLKTLAPESKVAGQQNLADRLEAALPSSWAALLKSIAEVAHEQHAALFIVGGFVRDLWLNRPSLDFDLVVEGDAIKLAHTLESRYGGRVTTHARFGTAKWRLEGSAFQEAVNPTEAGVSPLQSLDLVTARTEFYTHPSALPTIERGSIKLDLHRRDFTINTLALRLDGHHYGELHDYWGGLNDLRHGVIRVLHSLSFIDDPTRMLRAARFEQRFDFHIEPRTLQLMHEAISLMDRVSGDRIRHELILILNEPRAAQILGRLDELKLLSAIHPELKWDAWLEQRITALPDHPPEPEWGLASQETPVSLTHSLAFCICLLRLSPQQAHQVCERLKIRVELRAAIQAAIGLWNDLPRLAGRLPSQATARLDETPALARYAVYLAVSDPALRSILEQYIQTWQKIMPSIDGHALHKVGLRPGPQYRSILSELRAAWLDGNVVNGEQEKALLDKLLVEFAA